MEPCDTPQLTASSTEKVPCTSTNCSRSLRYEENHSIARLSAQQLLILKQVYYDQQCQILFVDLKQNKTSV